MSESTDTEILVWEYLPNEDDLWCEIYLSEKTGCVLKDILRPPISNFSDGLGYWSLKTRLNLLFDVSELRSHLFPFSV